ncbi:DUF6059 family protein [Kitasatospora sp. NPDC059408]|uniref:DUF6059 family protein n=1 Tax=Kitasatospora sp. NPDC059408 TaxID=3346823 RepID=UPI0036C1B957
MSGILRSWGRRCARAFWSMLISYGSSWVHVPVLPPEEDGPGRWHPERLCPEVPLTPLERFLAEQLGTGPF